MKREIRYTVLKNSDIEKYLNDEAKELLAEICFAVYTGRTFDKKPKLECVVVESDWEEYEMVWDAIEKRVDGED